MATIDLDMMLEKVRGSQWALADIDWDAPGAELITPEQWPKLKAFMSDLVWIEHVGARGFAAMARSAPNDTLRNLYSYFHAEEQRHANAELALMKRWGMLEDGEIPKPNKNIRLVIEWLDRCADSQPYHVLGSVIPALEVALDGALCKFLLDTVDDPVCHQAFAKINEDESRHLGVGFTVMEQQGHDKTLLELVQMLVPVLDPRLLLGIVIYFPLLNKMRDNVVGMGLSEERLYGAMRKFKKIGGRTAEGRRNPWFHFISNHMQIMINRSNRLYHVPVDAMVRITDLVPEPLLPRVPSWVKELTWRPYA
ncbi:MAG: ferritin-like domain-containing protein [Alcanivoracaceae bacterium]